MIGLLPTTTIFLATAPTDAGSTRVGRLRPHASRYRPQTPSSLSESQKFFCFDANVTGGWRKPFNF